jgi:hypothetical protein
MAWCLVKYMIVFMAWRLVKHMIDFVAWYLVKYRMLLHGVVLS